MPFDLLDGLFDGDDRRHRGRRSGIGGMLGRLFGGDREDDDRRRTASGHGEHARARRYDSDEDGDRRDDDAHDRAYGRRRRERDFALFD